MKIAFVLSHCHYHGSSKYILEISKYLSKWGCEVHVFANTCDREKFIRFHKIPAIGKEYSLLENFTIFTLESMIMKFRQREFDLTITQPGRYLTPSICHVRFLTKTAIKLAKAEGRKVSFKSKLFVKLEERALKKCKHVIAMSNLVKSELIKNYAIGSEKISVIYDGVNTKLFSPKNKTKYRKKVRENLGIEKDDITLLFVGNPFSRKGLHYLIESLKYIKQDNCKLLILGKSLPKDSIEKYLNLAKSLKIKNRESKIIYAGFSKEIHKYFAAGDIFVFPTLYEPFGLVILEAMSSGLAVITSSPSYCGAAEIIENNREGLLLENPRNAKEIAEKINLLLENPYLRKKLARNARKKAEKFTWKRTAKEFLRVFEKIARA